MCYAAGKEKMTCRMERKVKENERIEFATGSLILGLQIESWKLGSD